MQRQTGPKLFLAIQPGMVAARFRSPHPDVNTIPL